MRKNKGNAKRILALMLAFALVLGNVGVSFADEISGEEKIEALAEAQEEAKVVDGAKGAEGAQVVEDAEEVPKAKADAEAAKGEKAEEAEPAESEKKNSVKALSEETASEDKAEEASAQKLEFENDDVKITVSEEKAGVIPAGVNLKVTPIQKGDKANEEEGILGYEDVEKKLNEKAAGEEYEIAGFLAYDIKLVNKDGNEVEPNGEVKVSMEYKKATAPEGVDAETVKGADVTVMHLEEDEKGEVKDVVDMSQVVPEGQTEQQAENKIETLNTDAANNVEKTEFVTETFSIYSITWNVMNSQAAVFQNEKDYIFYVQSGNDYYALSYDGGAVKLPSNVFGTPSTSFYGIKEIQDTAFEGNPDYRNILWTCDFLSAQKATFNNVGNGTKYIALNNNGVTEDVAEGIDPEKIVFEYSGEAISRAAGYLHNNATGGLYLNYDSNQKKFTAVNSKSNTCKVYIARVEKLPSGDPKVIPDNKKVTNSDVGITMNVFDYYGTDNNKHGGGLDTWKNQYGSVRNSGINYNNHQLWFMGYGTPAGFKVDDNGSYSQYNNHTDKILVDINSYADTGVDRATQGIVTNELVNGYPYLKARTVTSRSYQHPSNNWWRTDTVTVTGESLDYLFNPTKTGVSGRTAYANVDGLLQKDSDGFYYYDSDYNYARLNTTTNKFILYDRTYLTREGDDGVQHPIGFFPFNNYDATKTDIGCNAYRDNSGTPQYEKEDNNNNAYNHHFGMTMSAKFVLGNEGKYNGKDTVYHFSGDDDMWVYIDDVLVLDIGGIHEPVDGYINFATGEVVVEGACTVGDYYNDPTGTTRTTLSDIFTAAGKTWNGSVNSVHTIKTFYMERGGQYSNLSLSFNLQIIPEKTDLTVKKEWRDGDSTAVPGNYEVKVQLLADGQPVNNGAVTLNKTNGWSKTFTDLNKYKVDGDGKSQLIVYSFREEHVHDLDKKSGQTGYDLTDKYTPFLTTVDNGKTTTINIENVKKKAKMTVSKTFKGLKWSQIQELMSSHTVDGVTKPAFGITITSKADSSITKTVTLNGTDPAPVITYVDSAGDKKTIKLSDRSTYPADDAVRPYTFLWTIEGLEPGEYTVSEDGKEYQGYTVTASGLGDVEVKLENWTLQYTNDFSDPKGETECDIHQWLLGGNGIIVISLTGNTGGYLVYSVNELTNTQELKILDMINKKEQPFTTFKTGTNATTSNTRFYYNDQLSQDKAVNPNGQGVVYIDKNKEVLHFDKTSIWQHVLVGQVDWININGKDVKNGDINVSNAYEPLVNLDLEKVSTSDATLKLTGAEFELYYKAEASGTYAIVTAAEGKYTPLKDENQQDRNAFEVSNSTAADSEDLKNLKPGFYYLKEITAPAGYSLLTEQLYFKVVFDSTTNRYKPEKCDASGNASTSTSYDLNGTTIVMQIKNAPIYSLPSTGGIGIYLPTFVGALLMAFALFLYDRRRVAVRVQ